MLFEKKIDRRTADELKSKHKALTYIQMSLRLYINYYAL